MSLRFWLLLGVIFAALTLGISKWALTPDSGEVEFHRAQEAMKSVKSWKFTQVADPNSPFSQEGSWEVDCATGWHGVVHETSSLSEQDRVDETVEFSHVGGTTYMRTANGEWGPAESYSIPESDPFEACAGLPKGEARFPFPSFSRLTDSSFITSNGKKTVNGVKCREWRVQVVKLMHREDLTVCLGVNDHLPYETAGQARPHFIFSDYNKPVQVEGPR